MTILDRLLGHDAWTTRQLLLRCRELPDEALDRGFDNGNRSLRATFAHIVGCTESHTDLLLERKVTDPQREDETVDGMIRRWTAVAKEFSEIASRVDREGTADETCARPGSTHRLPRGSVIAHILTHSERHRAQALYILEQLGLPDLIEADALGWEGQARGWGYDWCNSYGKVVAG